MKINNSLVANMGMEFQYARIQSYRIKGFKFFKF